MYKLSPINRLEKDKAGRVTFIPLNKLEASEPTYPRTQTSVPLIERLTFNSAYRKAFIQVFGRTILCASLEEASSIAKTSNIDCITIDGRHRFVLVLTPHLKVIVLAGKVPSLEDSTTNGIRVLRYFFLVEVILISLQSMKAIRESADQIADLEGQLATLQTDLTKTENLITKYVGQLQEIEKERVQERATFEKFSHDSAGAKNTLLSLQVDSWPRFSRLSPYRVRNKQRNTPSVKLVSPITNLSKLNSPCKVLSL